MNQLLFAWLSVANPVGTTLFLLKAMAEWPLYGVPFLIAGVWLFGARHDRQAAVGATVTACLALVLAHVASTAIDHPRPFMLGLARNVLDHPPDSSFPSDHATLFFALAAAFGLRPSPRLRWFGALLGIVGLALGAARVALGVHFPFDVIGAAAIATGAALIVAASPLRRPLAALTSIGEAVRDRVPGLPHRDLGPAATVTGGDARSAG